MVVELDPQLMDVLACPCPEHGELRAGTAGDPAADALTCGACGRSFPVTDGIPVLLLDEALPGTGPAADPGDDRGDPGDNRDGRGDRGDPGGDGAPR